MSVVFETTKKSSAVSVWILPGLDARERVAIFPSGSPVEKEKEAADACNTSRSKASAPRMILFVGRAGCATCPSQRRVGVSFIDLILFRSLIDFIWLIVVKQNGLSGSHAPV